MVVSLDTPLKKFTRVGAVIAGRLTQLGPTTVEGLLFYYPTRYDDYSTISSINQLTPEFVGTIHGKVQKIQNIVTRHKRMHLTEAIVFDDTGTVKAVWYNQSYLMAQIKQGDMLSLAGKVEYTGKGYEMRSPEWERYDAAGATIHTGRLVPVYPLTAGITQKQIRFLVSQALQARGGIDEWLPLDTIEYDLMGIQDALAYIHFPTDKTGLGKARLRLKFDELFLLQIRKAITKKAIQSSEAYKILFQEGLIKKFVQSLPFTLTNAQRKAAWQILRDVEKNVPMNRLLQGDVGSGKTLVAVIGLLNTALNGFQSVIMAPTEILAKQHYETVCSLLSEWKEVDIALWTRSNKEIKSHSGTSGSIGKANTKPSIKTTQKRSKILKSIQSGEADIVIGTHALIQEAITFQKLGFVVVDEQHRFGVEQRKKLKNKGGGTKSPHFLSMTATPIPRSLSLTAYGDLDLSIIDEVPPGRKPVITKVVQHGKRKSAYEFIQNQVKSGRQVFVICPLIEESDFLGVKAATTEFKKLDTDVFPNLRMGLLHGKLKDAEKDEVQNAFKTGVYDILVATSVVEVGVDVPNASVIMIEGAERFGLAQLHQFRGRVGRGRYQSYCFLFTDSRHQSVYERLDFLTATHDGFKIAEYDMQIRGAGNMYGVQQSGVHEFKIASFNDYSLIEYTQSLARRIIEDDPQLALLPKLRAKVESMGGTVHLE